MTLFHMWRRFLLVLVVAVGSPSVLCAQSASPAGNVALPQAIYTPRPVYRPEWAKQGLSGKGVVLVTIDPTTGKVSGARMLDSTGNKLLDGAALEAYSQWRFKPGSSVLQVKMPIEFAKGPARPPPKQKLSKPAIFFAVVLLGFALAMLTMRRRQGG
jgi:TonB family protein